MDRESQSWVAIKELVYQPASHSLLICVCACTNHMHNNYVMYIITMQLYFS